MSAEVFRNVRHGDCKYHKDTNRIEIWFDCAEDGELEFHCTVDVAEVLMHNLSVTVDEAKGE
jgi:hypothetical protein